MSRYEVGQGVKLKAGESPLMTVTRSTRKRVEVAFWDTAERRFVREEFPPAALTPDPKRPAGKTAEPQSART